MNATDVLEVSREAIWVMLKISAPLMIVALVVGLVVSLVQALTQIQEQTLTFVPRLLLLAVLFIVTMPWMLQMSVYFTAQMIWEAAKVGQ